MSDRVFKEKRSWNMRQIKSKDTKPNYYNEASSILKERTGAVRKIDLEEINSMDGFDFETLISDLLGEMGFIVEQTKKTADGGIDINAYSEEPIISGRYVVQCKRSSSPISEHVVRDLYGVMTAEKANKGILITNSSYTPASIKFAKGKPIELIEGTQLIGLLAKHFDLEQPDSQKVVPLIDKLLFKELQKIVTEMKKEHDTIKSGLVYKKKKEYPLEGNRNYFIKISEESEHFQLFTDLMKNFISASADKQDVSKENASVWCKQYVEKFESFISGFFANWKEFYFIKPPERCNEMHQALSDVYESLFASLYSWIEKSCDSIDNPEKYVTEEGVITLAFEMDDDFICERMDFVSDECESISAENEAKQQQLSSGCFIATACYSQESQEIQILRQFRDKFLLKHDWGVKVVKVYYKLSPKYADMIKKNNILKIINKAWLKPIICFIRKFCVK
ncbi:MAG: restriction endonuclease [Candidatus Pacebacteria bacterium]|nr:restriction endonuclease [Candidatus Paceibacterota bacterium]